MKKVAALLVLALAALTLVACGSDSDSDSTSTSAETTAESTGGGSEGSSAVSVVEIEAAEGTDLAYTTDAATTTAGQVSIDFTNPQTLSHDVAIEDSSGKELGGTDLIADGATTATIGDLEAGEYTFYCTVPGHREAGMEGTLTVE